MRAIVTALLVSACATGTAAANHHRSNQFTYVDSVHVSGRAHVILRSSKKAGRFSVMGGNSPASYTVSGNVISVVGSANDQGRPAEVMIQLKQPLHELSVEGSVRVDARKLKTSRLHVILNDHAVLDLKGMIDLASIKQFAASSARVDWVKSKHVSVSSRGLATTYLAGSVGHLDVALRGNSTFYGQYLDTKNLFLSTKGNAMAYVNPTESMRVFSRQRSNAYYFTKPLHQTVQLSEHGNALHVMSTDPWHVMVGFYQHSKQKPAESKHTHG